MVLSKRIDVRSAPPSIASNLSRPESVNFTDFYGRFGNQAHDDRELKNCGTQMAMDLRGSREHLKTVELLVLRGNPQGSLGYYKVCGRQNIDRCPESKRRKHEKGTS